MYPVHRNNASALTEQEKNLWTFHSAFAFPYARAFSYVELCKLQACNTSCATVYSYLSDWVIVIQIRRQTQADQLQKEYGGL